jgi:3-oxoacyl-[acyl-carrier protein] reductase
MTLDYSGQTVLITGATRGIGKQIADDFIKLNANCILTGSKKEQIDLLNKNQNENIKYIAVDFSDKKSVDEFLERVKEYNKIDVCINNAGINRINPIDETLLEDYNDVLAVNLEAPFRITRLVSSMMKKNNYGRIINIASIFGVISKAKRSLYSMSKFGLRGLTVSTAIELAPYNILVNSVSPGFVLTELTQSILSEQEIKDLAEQVPMKRFASPEEISSVIMFLASKNNTYLTGQNIIVDGGFVNV